MLRRRKVRQSATEQSFVALNSEAAGGRFSEGLERLSRFRDAHKRKVKFRSHQKDWMDEHRRLRHAELMLSSQVQEAVIRLSEAPNAVTTSRFAAMKELPVHERRELQERCGAVLASTQAHEVLVSLREGADGVREEQDFWAHELLHLRQTLGGVAFRPPRTDAGATPRFRHDSAAGQAGRAKCAVLPSVEQDTQDGGIIRDSAGSPGSTTEQEYRRAASAMYAKLLLDLRTELARRHDQTSGEEERLKGGIQAHRAKAAEAAHGAGPASRRGNAARLSWDPSRCLAPLLELRKLALDAGARLPKLAPATAGLAPMAAYSTAPGHARSAAEIREVLDFWWSTGRDLQMLQWLRLRRQDTPVQRPRPLDDRHPSVPGVSKPPDFSNWGTGDTADGVIGAIRSVAQDTATSAIGAAAARISELKSRNLDTAFHACVDQLPRSFPRSFFEHYEVHMVLDDACERLRDAERDCFEQGASIQRALVRQCFRAEGTLGSAVSARKADIFSPTGGWAREDHLRFLQALRQSKEKGYEHQLDRLLLELGHQHSRCALQNHLEWFRQIRGAAEKALAARSALLARRDSIVHDLGCALADCEGVLQKRRESEQETRRLENVRRQLHGRLESMRAEREATAQVAMEDRARKREGEARRKDAEAERERLRREEIQRQLNHLQHARELENEREASAARLAAKQAKQERTQRMKDNSMRVAYRQGRLALREDARLAAQKRSEQAAERRLEGLARLAASVPYYERVVNARADLTRTTVAATRHSEGFVPQDPNEPAVFRNAMHGYDSKAVFKDARFRIGLALRAAGIAHTSAAASLVRSLAPRAQAPFATGA